MTVTVWGEAGGPNTIAANRNRYGQITEARSYRDLELELPAGGIGIDCDHDGRVVGSLVYAELDDDRLRAVAVIDDDWLMNVDEPVYFSPAFEMRGNGIDRSDTYIARTAEMIGLSVTFQTARVGAHPVSRRQGDLRDSSDRFKWPCSWQRSEPLLARALDRLGTDWQVRTRSAERIIDRRDDGEYPWHLLPARSRPAGELHLRQPAGKLRYWPSGRIISVS